ncbi:MAG: GerW family sporulation protein [Oscillospiraceae bacterium]|nr:GerW family sporulation protein [Oscillospiraceae bacterium]MBR1842232.1 GerW family sporulation protein [Oscillospiraceae bacterium]
MDKNNASALLETILQNVKALTNSNTAIGEPIVTPDGITMIPVSRISYGFATGGSDISPKNGSNANPFGGGGGAGVKINPTAFVVIKDGHVRIMNVEAPAVTTLERLLDAAPDLIDKVQSMTKKDEPKDETATTVVIDK